MKICLSDNGLHLRFAPLSFTRPLAEISMGMFTNTERWKMWVPNAEISFETERYLYGKFAQAHDVDVYVAANIIPDQNFVDAVLTLPPGHELTYENERVAWRKGETGLSRVYNGFLTQITQPWELFQRNGDVLCADFEKYTKNKVSRSLSSSNTLLGRADQLFIEEGAKIEACIINTSCGPVYIGKDAEIMEGSMLRGPLYIGEHAGVKMGSKIYGPTSIGPECRIGGEISNVVMQAYSNKGHDGFLGNALIGSWCNLGADTNASNLKNNYSTVKAWSYESNSYVSTELQFMGLIMGDHSKCGINTMFNTATVVGVSCNVYGAGFPPKHIPSFSWGGADGFEAFDKHKAIEAAQAMMIRRKVDFTEGDQQIFNHLHPGN